MSGRCDDGRCVRNHDKCQSCSTYDTVGSQARQSRCKICGSGCGISGGAMVSGEIGWSLSWSLHLVQAVGSDRSVERGRMPNRSFVRSLAVAPLCHSWHWRFSLLSLASMRPVDPLAGQHQLAYPILRPSERSFSSNRLGCPQRGRLGNRWPMSVHRRQSLEPKPGRVVSAPAAPPEWPFVEGPGHPSADLRYQAPMTGPGCRQV